MNQKFYEVKVKGEKMNDEGLLHKVVELYLVDALSCTEAEKRTVEEAFPYYNGEVEVIAIKQTNYSECVRSNDDGDIWYKVRCEIITIDEVRAKEKKTSVAYMFEAKSVDDARKKVAKFMEVSMSSYKITSISETTVLDVFFYDKNAADGCQLQTAELDENFINRLSNDPELQRHAQAFKDMVRASGYTVSISHAEGGRVITSKVE